jgi:hypothetical protein
MARTTRGIVADQAILRALEDGPLSTREIANRIFREAREAWSERHGYDFEWGTDEEPLGARLLASAEARESGLVLLAHEVAPRLRALERRGDVARVQLEGHRPMLWRLA